MPLPMIRAIMAREGSDTFHAGNRLTFTRLLGCPREHAILDNLPIIFNVSRWNSLTMGTAVHKELEKHVSPGDYAELSFPLHGKLPPLICGVRVSGRLDWVKGDFTEIQDYKVHSEMSQWGKVTQKSYIVDVDAQLNFARIAIAKEILKVSPSEYTPKMLSWHGCMSSAEGPPAWIPHESPVLDEEDLSQYAPGGGTHTVTQIADYNQTFTTRLRDGVPVSDAIRAIPLVGRNQIGGQKCLKWCNANIKGENRRGICDQIEGITEDGDYMKVPEDVF